MVVSLPVAASNSQHPQDVPKEEESILNYLLGVRNLLGQLKQNRRQYLNSKEVQNIYQQVLTKVRELDQIRKSSHDTPSNSATTLIHSTELHNRVDSVLDDVFQLLSLCFLTVGLKNSAPATYASLSTVQRLLEHLNESNVFTQHDLRPIRERLLEISKIVENSSYKNEVSGDNLEDIDEKLPEADRKFYEERNKNKIEEDLLLRAKLQHCLDEYHSTESKVEEIDPHLTTIMEKLFEIRRGLLSLAASSKRSNPSLEKSPLSQEHVHEQVEKLESQLTELESHRDENGKFKSLETDKVEDKGQNVLNGLLDDCHDLISDLSHQKNGGIELDAKLQPIYEQLIDIKTSLENLLVTRRWTLRETDLFTFQKQLSETDSLRVHGKFPTDSGTSKGQSILLYLLRRCFAIIYKLLESSEPVSESLQPIHNQLSTVRRCLLELKRMGGVNNDRELYPYQMKLASLDDLRTDGKFYDSDGNIPEGQGTLNALLAECFDIVHELNIEAQERAETESAQQSEAEQDDGLVNDTDNDNDGDQPVARYLDVHNQYSNDDDEDEEEEDGEEASLTNASEHSYVDEEENDYHIPAKAHH